MQLRSLHFKLSDATFNCNFYDCTRYSGPSRCNKVKADWLKVLEEVRELGVASCAATSFGIARDDILLESGAVYVHFHNGPSIAVREDPCPICKTL